MKTTNYVIVNISFNYTLLSRKYYVLWRFRDRQFTMVLPNIS